LIFVIKIDVKSDTLDGATIVCKACFR